MIQRTPIRLSAIALFILALGTLEPTLLRAQYFGRNKVQYERFDFKILKTQHFDVYFYPEMQEAARQAARMAERWYARLSRIFNHKLKGRQPLILYASSPHFQQTTVLSGYIGEGTGGVTEALKRRIILPVGGTLQDTDHVIGHELVHAFQYDMTSQGQSGYGASAPGITRLPLWFVEGLAEYLSVGPVDPNTAMWMRDVTRRRKIPTLKKLEDPQYFPYRYGQALWAYITGKYGDRAVQILMREVGRMGELEASVKRGLKVSFEQLSKEWKASLEKRYDPLVEMTVSPEDISRPVIKATREKGINISPSLSPDGSHLIFLSSRDLFSIDLYLADTATGKILRRLVKTAANPHFESLQFIKSAGSWDAQGRRFAFGAVTKGKPVLVILDALSGKREKEWIFRELGEILNPSWSPDGKTIAFSALQGGLTDIFLFDLETEELKKLTDDPYSDLSPVWSPDGRTLAFVTDRFTSDLSILNIGPLQIALLDPETGKMEKLPGFQGAKNINPQWSPDGRSLFFISDQSGIPDVYRLDLDTGHIFQITNLYTGVSGITSLSPALSVARRSGNIAFSVYIEDNYSIYAMDSPEQITAAEPRESFGEINPSILPPRTSGGGDVLALLNNPLFGLPEERDFEISDYKPKLSLDYVSPAQLAVGADRFGTYAGGGITLYFTDMLGYHTLFTMAQTSNRVEDSALLVGYLNSARRLNWGASLERIPYVIGGFATGVEEYFGELTYVEQEYIFRQINYQASLFAYYPFNQVRRFEMSAGYRFIDYQQEVRTRNYSFDGFFLDERRMELPAPDSIHFAFATAALVYDSSFFGATAPIIGQSYRLEVTPYLGSLSYISLLADYRRYLMPRRPFTLAFRLLHYGRYGGNAEDDRFYPLYLGYETLVRGYNTYSFDADEADIYYRLTGSKMVVANMELRFPLFGVLGLGRGYYGILPMDFVVFYDTGVAWWEDDELYDQSGGLVEKDRKAWFLGGGRHLVSSAGIGLRMNLFGYLVMGFNMVRPFDRPNKGWVFQFTLTPGF